MHCTDLKGFPFSEHRVPSGNLEFRFSGPGSIPNAVEQYNVLRGAELAELRRRKERKNSVPVFCKVRCPASDVTSMVTSRDVDVVTQLSLNESDEDDNEEEGIDASGMGNTVRLCGGSEAPDPKVQLKGKGKNKAKVKARKLKAPAKSSRKEQQHQQQQRLRPNTEQNDDFLERLQNLHLEVCAELQTLAKEEEVKKPSPRAKKVTTRKLTRKPNIRRLEGGAPQKEDATAPNPQEPSPEAGACEQVCYEDYFLPQPQWVDIMPSAMMSHGISVNVCACPAATPHSAYKFMEQYGSLEPESLTPFFREDSDLDHEFANRKGYLRYVEPRPPLDHNEDAPNNAEHHGSVVDTCFVEVERLPYKLSLLRSLTPMRYTSQCSELTQRPEALEPPSPPAPTMDADADDVEEIALELQSKKRRGPRKAAATTRPGAKANANSGKEGRVSSHNALKAASPPASAPTPAAAPAPAPAPAQATTPRRQQQKRRKPCSLVVYSKSLENLKSEKLRIYNKISFTHERIIGAVDRLQISLLQLPPASRQRSVPEQERRQRNAFEFCVRFARNFLYPLKGMIDDVRLTPVASFNSAISNEASHRVMCVYGLMLQSLQNYQRHLRYFLLEKVAQKLSALIEMIYTMTNCCLDKNILARHDPVVESLLERCTRFLSFIEDLQQERIKLARETQRRRHLQQPLHPGSAGVQNSARSRRSPQLRSSPQKEKQLRSHERYDLKMCLNDFKVYEPRVVPKERPRACDKGIFRRRRRTAQVNAAAAVPEPSSELQSVKDDVRTQMQIQAQAKDGDGGDDDDDSTSSTVTVAEVGSYGNQAFGGASSPLREAMLEAVRRATPSQLQEVVNPMMRSLKMGDCQCLDK